MPLEVAITKRNKRIVQFHAILQFMHEALWFHTLISCRLYAWNSIQGKYFVIYASILSFNIDLIDLMETVR